MRWINIIDSFLICGSLFYISLLIFIFVNAQHLTDLIEWFHQSYKFTTTTTSASFLSFFISFTFVFVFFPSLFSSIRHKSGSISRRICHNSPLNFIRKWVSERERERSDKLHSIYGNDTTKSFPLPVVHFIITHARCVRKKFKFMSIWLNTTNWLSVFHHRHSGAEWRMIKTEREWVREREKINEKSFRYLCQIFRDIYIADIIYIYSITR
jgi:hypothetical protein